MSTPRRGYGSPKKTPATGSFSNSKISSSEKEEIIYLTKQSKPQEWNGCINQVQNEIQKSKEYVKNFYKVFNIREESIYPVIEHPNYPITPKTGDTPEIIRKYEEDMANYPRRKAKAEGLDHELELNKSMATGLLRGRMSEELFDEITSTDPSLKEHFNNDDIREIIKILKTTKLITSNVIDLPFNRFDAARKLFVNIRMYHPEDKRKETLYDYQKRFETSLNSYKQAYSLYKGNLDGFEKDIDIYYMFVNSLNIQYKDYKDDMDFKPEQFDAFKCLGDVFKEVERWSNRKISATPATYESPKKKMFSATKAKKHTHTKSDKVDKSEMYCTHCKKSNHNIDTCFFILGKKAAELKKSGATEAEVGKAILELKGDGKPKKNDSSQKN